MACSTVSQQGVCLKIFRKIVYLKNKISFLDFTQVFFNDQ